MCRRRFNFGHTLRFGTSGAVLTCIHFSRSRIPSCAFPLFTNRTPHCSTLRSCPKRCACGCPGTNCPGSGISMRAFSVGSGIAHRIGLPVSTSKCVPHVHFARSPGGLTVVALGHRRGHFSVCFTSPHDAIYGLTLHSRSPCCVGRGMFSGVRFCPRCFDFIDSGDKCPRLC